MSNFDRFPIMRFRNVQIYIILESYLSRVECIAYFGKIWEKL